MYHFWVGGSCSWNTTYVNSYISVCVHRINAQCVHAYDVWLPLYNTRLQGLKWSIYTPCLASHNAYIHRYVYIYIYTCIHRYVYIYVYTYIHIYIGMYIYMYVGVWHYTSRIHFLTSSTSHAAYIYTYMRIYTYIYMYVYVLHHTSTIHL